MKLPVLPPVEPMLAKAAAKVPTGAYLYEPKWDGSPDTLICLIRVN